MYKKIRNEFSFIEIIALLVIIAIFVICIFGTTGCTQRDADVASYNVSKEADQFRVKRRITFINLRSNEYLFSLIGNCSIEDNTSNELEVICKIGDDKYQKHYLYKSDETTYIVEQLDYSEVSKYDYEIVFKPESIVPYKVEKE
mgnify:CR=1 FL=1|nr:MAG TPA: hypothetical protein [Caudoviricetes sp.]